MTNDSNIILGSQPIGQQLPGIDPFIFGAYHNDRYPRGNGQMGPDPTLLKGRNIGSDFSGKDGFSMYHGETIPGFPAHPHRGFETVTIVRKGLVDHADSLGATARYGEGDVQWLTTGSGVQHGEMFPLVHDDKDNTLDLFQIWLNLPAKNKMAAPNFTMFWAHQIPHFSQTDDQGRKSNVRIIAGDYAPVNAAAEGGQSVIKALTPPPTSWASEPDADVAIWVVTLEPGASLVLPAASTGTRRALYLTSGKTLTIGDHAFNDSVMVEVRADVEAPLHNHGTEVVEVLMLQGRPIGEPVVAHGPFVANTQEELLQAIREYERTEFGGWPWPSPAHTHGKSDRFAQYPDGSVENP